MIRSLTSSVAIIVSFFFCDDASAARWSWEIALTQYSSAWQIAPQSDGKAVIFGDFDFAGRIRRENLARLNSDGSLDLTYSPSLESQVLGISPLGDELLVATLGYHTRLQKLNKDGAVDPGFVSPVIAVGFAPHSANPYSFPAHKLASGKILMLGAAQSPGKPAGFGLIRLNADGGHDETFNPPQLSMEGAFSMESTGTILVISRSSFGSALMRLHGETGETIKTFSGISYSKDVFALPTGKFLLLGQFPDGREIKRFHNDGSEDLSYVFDPGQDLWRSPIRLRDGTFFWFGSPSMILDAEGELTRTLPNADDFNPNYGGVAEMPDGRIIYSAYDFPSNEELRQTTHGVHRRGRDGVLDPTFAVPGGLMRVGENGRRFSMEYGAANSLYLAGSFAFVNGTNTGPFARLNADKSLNGAFVNNVRTQASGRNEFVVEHTNEKTLLVNGSVRLDANGELLLTLPSLHECLQMFSVIPLSNGAFIYNYTPGGPCYVQDYTIGTTYRAANGNSITGFGLKQGDGYPGFYSSGIHAAVPAAADGKFLIGGHFTSINDAPATNLALITAAGEVDPSFTLTEIVYGPDYLFRHGDEFIAINDLAKSFHRIDQQGRVILKKDFPRSISSIANALLDAAGRLNIFTYDRGPALLISVFDPDGTLVQSLRIPYDFSSSERPVGRFTPEGDLLIGGWYLGDDANAWSGVVRVPATELRPLRVDVSMANESWTLTVRGIAGATVGIYSSSDLQTWARDRGVTVSAEGGATLTLEPSIGANYFKAQLE